MIREHASAFSPNIDGDAEMAAELAAIRALGQDYPESWGLSKSQWKDEYFRRSDSLLEKVIAQQTATANQAMDKAVDARADFDKQAQAVSDVEQQREEIAKHLPID